MARLDAARVAAWRELQSVTAELERAVDEALVAEWDVSLGWFDVLAGLQRLAARPGRATSPPNCGWCAPASADASTASRRRGGWRGVGRERRRTTGPSSSS